MEKSILTEVKAILKSLVLSSPDKITVEKLNRDYRDVEGQFIPFRQLGYGNLEQFLCSIPDTLRVFGSGPSAMVCFVANEKSDHIHDMIMKQKKPKTKARTRPNNRNRSNAFQNGNKINTNTFQQTRHASQQLSPFQSVNRNYMTKTIQVRNVPYWGQATCYVPTPLSNQILYSLPQPNGVLFNARQHVNPQIPPVLSSIRKGVVKAVNSKEQVSQLSNMLKEQCNVNNPPPPLPRDQNRSVKFSEQNTISVEEKTQGIEPVQKNSTDVKQSVDNSLTETIFSLEKIKAPTAKKQIPIKLSDEVESLLNMPKLSKVINPIEEPTPKLSNNEENIKCSQLVNAVKTTQTFFDDTADGDNDPEEAIPFFAAKDNVFRLDFPEHTVSYGNKIAPYTLPDEVIVGSQIKIFISEIHNPFKFWFHIHKDNHELDLLMYQIERYYSTLDSDDLCIPTACLTPGQVCAACYNGLWHRAEIVGPPVNKNIKVSFMDYGTVTEVKLGNIKFLVSYFAQLPAQALRGCLSHIKPCGFHWSHEATTYFLKLVADLMLYAKITEIDIEKNVLYMVLCDTNGDEVVQINTSLVYNGYACYSEDWKPENVKQNNGKRVHHPREDFPTFSMIETGEYPSFPELVSLQQRGIDYEAIYDLIIYNQSSILNKHESASEGLRNLPYFLTTSNPFRSDILFELYATTSKAI